MAVDDTNLSVVAAIAEDLHRGGHSPVLVGGMALIMIGSQRITMDYDLLVSPHGPTNAGLVKIMYRHGLQLVTKLNDRKEVVRTIDNSRVAAARVKMEKPSNSFLFFYNFKSRLRVDLLIDSPLPAEAIAGRASSLRLPEGAIAVASPEDLLELKEIAYADRKAAKDAQDLEFLRALIKRGK